MTSQSGGTGDREPEMHSGTMDHWLQTLVVLATVLLASLAIVGLVRLLSAIHHTLLLFSLGGLLAYALDPLVEWLRRVRLVEGAPLRHRGRCVLGMFGALAFIILVSTGVLGGFVGREISMLNSDHQVYVLGTQPTSTPAQQQLAKRTYAWRAQRKLAEEDAWLTKHGIPLHLQANLQHPAVLVKKLSQKVTQDAIQVFAGIGKSVVEGVLVVLISLYFMVYSEELKHKLVNALPPRLQPYAVRWQDDVNEILGGFVRGQLVLALVMGLLAGLLCLVLDLKLWVLLGLVVMVASLIPVVGPYVGAVPAVIAALISPAHGFLNPTSRVIILLLAFVVINEVGSKVLYPRLVGKALGLHEVLVLFVLLAGFEVSGLTGVLFAAPLTALIIATLPQVIRLWQGTPPMSLSSVNGHHESEVNVERRLK